MHLLQLMVKKKINEKNGEHFHRCAAALRAAAVMSGLCRGSQERARWRCNIENLQFCNYLITVTLSKSIDSSKSELHSRRFSSTSWKTLSRNTLEALWKEDARSERTPADRKRTIRHFRGLHLRWTFRTPRTANLQTFRTEIDSTQGPSVVQETARWSPQ